MGYLFDFFWDIPRMFLDFFQIILNNVVCLSVFWLAYFFTESMSLLGYLQFWIRYISVLLGEIQIILYFLYVCQSLISLPIGNFWGSTSETSGLVHTLTAISWLRQISFASLNLYRVYFLCHSLVKISPLLASCAWFSSAFTFPCWPEIGPAVSHSSSHRSPKY